MWLKIHVIWEVFQDWRTTGYKRGNKTLAIVVDISVLRVKPPLTYILVSIVGSLRDRDVACSTSDRQGSNFESCVWRTVSSQSSHHPQEVLLAQFSLYVHKSGLSPIHSFFLHIFSSFCRSPGLECRILCLEDSVISIISPSSGGSPGPV